MNGKNLHDFTLVDNWIQRISHLVWNCRVYKSKEFTFSFWSVVKNFLWNIDKANHFFLDNICYALQINGRFNYTFIYFKELKFRNEFLVYAFHALQIFYNLIYVFWVGKHFGFVILNQIFLECKYFSNKIFFWEIWNFSQTILGFKIIAAFWTMFWLIWRNFFFFILFFLSWEFLLLFCSILKNKKKFQV